MGRTARRVSCTGMYHIMIRGINKDKIFDKVIDCEKMQKTLLEYLPEELEIYAYCIMPNHLHLMVRGDLRLISTYMRKIEGSYAAYYNMSRERVGAVFQGRFKSECIETESYFWNCLNYIHNNPVKANIIAAGENYRYSSMQEYKSTKIRMIHEKAIKLKQKNPERFGKIYVPEQYIIIDVPEEEEIQKKEYFSNQLKRFAKTTGNDIQTIMTDSNLKKIFIKEELKNGVLTKTMMEKACMDIMKV